MPGKTELTINCDRKQLVVPGLQAYQQARIDIVACCITVFFITILDGKGCAVDLSEWGDICFFLTEEFKGVSLGSQTDQDALNNGTDWPAANLAAGTLSMPFDASSAALKTCLGKQPHVDTIGEIWAEVEPGRKCMIAQFCVRVRNTAATPE